jgi:hypothetical protein
MTLALIGFSYYNNVVVIMYLKDSKKEKLHFYLLINLMLVPMIMTQGKSVQLDTLNVYLLYDLVKNNVHHLGVIVFYGVVVQVHQNILNN